MIENKYEFFETPESIAKYLFREVAIDGRVFSPCYGSGAIHRASLAVTDDHTDARIAEQLRHRQPIFPFRQWITNDLDPRWEADFHHDATKRHLWESVIDQNGGIDFTVENPPFKSCIDIIEHALEFSRIGVAMHLRASIHEVLKTGKRRAWMSKHEPTGILWLPRFGYQRSKTTGLWTTDSVTACWVIWYKDRNVPQFIRYAPESVLDELEVETPVYRKRMDALMGRTTELGV